MENKNKSKAELNNKSMYSKTAFAQNEALYKDPKSIGIDKRFDSRSKIMQSIELKGYKAANKVHKLATLGLISFMMGNVIWLLYKYNIYWKRRRVSFHLRFLGSL